MRRMTMPRWRIDLIDGMTTQIDATAEDIALIRKWLRECDQPVREIALVAEGIRLSVWQPWKGDGA